LAKHFGLAHQFAFDLLRIENARAPRLRRRTQFDRSAGFLHGGWRIGWQKIGEPNLIPFHFDRVAQLYPDLISDCWLIPHAPSQRSGSQQTTHRA
jgi:hypothetical protein